MHNEEWYLISNIDGIDSPALIVYPDRVNANIKVLKEMVPDASRLRPHTKTHKTAEGTLLLQDAGINKFKCATIAEAEMLGMCKAADVLLAYQPFGPKVQRYIQLVKNYPGTSFSCLSDNLESLKQLSQAAAAHHITIQVFIDLNTGMNRTGILPGYEAVQLYEEAARLENIHLSGFHLYDGHITVSDFDTRMNTCEQAFAPVEAMMQELKQKGYPQVKLIAGGSPTFPFYAKLKDVECSPGTFIFWDKGYQAMLPEQHFQPAALIITRVISLPAPNRLCLDLGYKAVSSENAPDKRIYFLNAPELKVISQSEEHLVTEAPENHTWKIGDVLYGLPFHICPSFALYDEAIAVVNGLGTGSWKIAARKRKIRI